MYENKTVEIQVIGYRLRPVKYYRLVYIFMHFFDSFIHSSSYLCWNNTSYILFLFAYRERLIGSVKINLSVLAQSSPYIADVAPSAAVGRKSFAARVSMSEALNAKDRDSAEGVPNSVVLANHCAWFALEKKGSKSSEAVPGSAGAGGAAGASNKDNSVVRLLSWEQVRMDIEDTQLRVGIKMIRNGV